MARANPEIRTFQGQGWINGVLNETYVSSTYSIYPYRRDYVSVKTPNYKTLRKKNLPFNPHTVAIVRDFGTAYRRTHYEQVKSTGAYTYYNVYDQSHAQRVRVAPPGLSHLTGASTLALGRASKELSAIKINLAQAFGERKQVANLLISTAVRIARAATALRQARFGDLYVALGLYRDPSSLISMERKVAKMPADLRLANYWLEYKYGWRPLLQDAYGAAELLAYHAFNDLYHERIEASGKETKTVETNLGVGGRSTNIVRTKAKYIFDYRLDSASRSALAQTGLSNPALLAWELLPYSFVVDWFIPVGNYLASLDAFSGFVLTKGCLVQLSEQVYDQDHTYASQTENGTHRFADVRSGSSGRHQILMNRTVLTSFPSQAFPSFRNPIGGDPIDRFTTAMSLLRAAFGTRTNMVR